MTENPDEVLALKGTSNDRAKHRISRGARTSPNLIPAVVNTAEEHTREVASFVLLLAKRARNAKPFRKCLQARKREQIIDKPTG